MFSKILFVGLSLYIAFVFMTAGCNKLFALDNHTHAYIVDSSKYWVDVFKPFFDAIHFTPSPDGLRHFLGISEILGAGALLLSAFGSGRCIGSLATLGLITIMIGALYLHYVFQSPLYTPALLIGLLVLRLLVTPSCKGKVKQQ
jgi:uncharacterized membrane protein YphA (DoxX/SURF4 family)|eukprot:TRINITY_DN100403_c0_g1_i1.p1 TRINITY_DN100403_c0_g1~~TRINITY_DN100403_c0_g1_i1.p1  ORF type:complete len:144 (-),score=1.51 TRINITY_DN100403_c0_g1_i1:16-447(-)